MYISSKNENKIILIYFIKLKYIIFNIGFKFKRRNKNNYLNYIKIIINLILKNRE